MKPLQSFNPATLLRRFEALPELHRRLILGRYAGLDHIELGRLMRLPVAVVLSEVTYAVESLRTGKPLAGIPGSRPCDSARHPRKRKS